MDLYRTRQPLIVYGTHQLQTRTVVCGLGGHLGRVRCNIYIYKVASLPETGPGRARPLTRGYFVASVSFDLEVRYYWGWVGAKVP